MDGVRREGEIGHHTVIHSVMLGLQGDVHSELVVSLLGGVGHLREERGVTTFLQVRELLLRSLRLSRALLRVLLDGTSGLSNVASEVSFSVLERGQVLVVEGLAGIRVKLLLLLLGRLRRAMGHGHVSSLSRTQFLMQHGVDLLKTRLE